MRKLVGNKGLLFIIIIVLLYSCNKRKKDDPSNDFDRGALLSNIGSSKIIPGYSTLKTKTTALKDAADLFTASPDETNLANVQDKFKQAYLAWEAMEVYEFGPASDIVLRASVNSFPTTISTINSNISSGSYDLDISGNIKAKGFPALDYLLFGVGADQTAIVAMYTSDTDAANRKLYLTNVIANMNSRIGIATNNWSAYFTTFTTNTSTDVGSSIGFLVNNMSMSLETVRRERIGTPLGYVGLVSTGTIAPQTQEAYYSNYSKELMLENLIQSKDLFNGGVGVGFDDYLNALDAKYDDGTLLASQINLQYNKAIYAVEDLDPDFTNALTNNVSNVETAFLEVKKLIVLIKLDMASQLGVVINYTDNDGD